MFLETMRVWYRRFFGKEQPTQPVAVPEPSPQPILAPLTEEQRRYWYRKGKREGAKHQVHIYVCPRCQADALHLMLPAQPAFPDIEQQTDSIAHIPTNRFLQWRMEQHQDIGPQTDVHRAIRWQK